MQCVTMHHILQHGFLVSECVRRDSSCSMYPLYQKTSSKTEPIVFQTPWLLLSTKPRYITRHNRRVYFINVESVASKNETCPWIDFLHCFQCALKHTLQKREPQQHMWVSMLEECTTYSFSSNDTIPSSTTSKNPIWKIVTSLSSSMKCFDTHQQHVSLDEFLNTNTNRHIRFLIRFSHIWVNHNAQTAGVSVDILQMQQHESAPCSTFAFTSERTPSRTIGTQTTFIPSTYPPTHTQPTPSSSAHSSSNAHDTRTQHPVYGKYFKMLNKRVPKPAVQHKMRMNGLDPGILDWDMSTPLPSVSKMTACDQLSLSLQDNHQLRKTEINTHPKKTCDGAGHGFSLDEIVNGLNSLRKTFMRTGKHETSKDVKKENVLSTLENGKIKRKKESSSSFIQLLGARFS